MSIVNKSVTQIKFFAVFVIIIALFGYKFTNTAAAQSTSTLSLSPSATTTTLGQSITFDLLVNQVTDLWNVYFDLLYDRNILAFSTATDGGFLSSDAASVSVLAATSTDTGSNDRLTFGITRLGGGLLGISTTSTSTIANLQFTTIGYGTTSLSFVDSTDATGIVDSNLVLIPSIWQNGGVTVGDITPPAITILTPTPSTTYNSSSTPITLTGTSTDNVLVTSVTWSCINGSTATGTASGTASWTASGITLLSGSNVISVVAYDAAGNTATDTLTIAFDNTAPVVTIISPTASATTSASSTSFTLSGTASDANSISSVTWSNSQGGSGTAVGTSSWSVAGSLLNLQTGSNLVTVTARDTFGNAATDTLTITFDSTAPTISIITPTASSTYFASSSPINLSGTATDNVAVTAVVLTGGSGTTTGTSSWSITGIALAGATTTLTVTVRDSLNNTATDSLVIYLDTVLPAIPTSTPGSASAASASQINLSWPAGSDTGNSGLAGYKIYRNSTSTAPVATIASTTTSYNDTGLSASTAYTYYIFAYDNAGNQSTNYATSSATTSAAPVTPPSGGGGGGGGSFTPPDTTPPARPANFRATPADGQIMLAWINPTESDFGGVLILRTASSTAPACPSAYNDSRANEVYRGNGIAKTDLGLNNNLKYCYAIFSFDNIPNYTTPSILTAQPGAGQLTTVENGISETVTNNQSGTTNKSTSLADAPSSVVDAVSSDEAHQIFDPNQFVEMTAVTMGIYNKIMAQAPSAGSTGSLQAGSGRAAGYNNQEKRALANFIQNGTANTRILGAGERGGSVGSFIAAFGRLPRSIADWQDVVKIGNGRWPKQINLKAEAAAEIVFKKIYLHAPKRATNKYEDNAIWIIAYGLRPAKRNMNSEAVAIKSFKYIYKRLPNKSNDWDVVRAIAYSGAKR